MRLFRTPQSIYSTALSLRLVHPRPADKFPTEEAYLDQDLPDPDLQGSEPNVPIPGDSFGITATRQTFLRPSNRYAKMPNPFKELFRGRHPQECVNPSVLRNLSARFALSYQEAAERMVEANMDPNLFLKDLESDQRSFISPNSYGLVAVEKYDPETFCLLSVSCPTFESTRDPAVLEALHEVVLSAAEIPVDVPRHGVVDKLLGEWTTESGDLCADVLKQYGLGVVDCILLPYGDYSAQGFGLNHASEDFPNIGTAASASCLDLRTGIHNRFRFHVERIADSVCDHAIHEAMHFGQQEHLLRQSYWFKPSYSVEEFIRFKERLLQPSANIFELRYALLMHPLFNLKGYRNVVEMEKLAIQQHRFEKNYEEFAGADKVVTTEGNLQIMSSLDGQPQGSTFSRHESLQTKVGVWHTVMKDGLQKREDRLFGHFYTNHYF